MRVGAREASDVDFIGGKAHGGANGVVISIILVFLAHHGQHLCHSVVDTFHTSTTGVICARRELMNP